MSIALDEKCSRGLHRGFRAQRLSELPTEQRTMNSNSGKTATFASRPDHPLWVKQECTHNFCGYEHDGIRGRWNDRRLKRIQFLQQATHKGGVHLRE